ncbi:MAG: response regulator [bacterium]
MKDGKPTYEELKAQAAELRLNEERHRNILNSMNDAVFVRLPEGRFLEFNQVACERYGYSRDELLQMTPMDLDVPEHAAMVPARTRMILENGKAIFETVHRTKDGKIIHAEISSRPIIYNRKQAILSIVRDVSERKLMQKNLEEAKAELEKTTEQLLHAQKMEAIGNLAGGMAHEFNNIIATISGTAEMLLRITGPATAGHSKAEQILKSCRRAKALTSKLLTFARKEKLRIKTTSLNVIIAEVVEILKGTISKNIRIETELSADTWHVAVDANQMIQALLNVCINACDAMPDGGLLKIQSQNIERGGKQTGAGGAGPGRFCAVTVSDTGKGIDKDIREKIFDPFFTTKERNKGSGLGLSISHGIVRAHDGFIRLERTGKNGTTFKILMPAAEPDAPSSETAPEEKPSKKAGGRILVIDDDRDFLQMAQEALEMEGFDVTVSQSGREAVEKYGKHMDEIDIVVLDMMMPEMSGSDVFHSLREINPSVNVVLCSGYSIEGAATHLLNDGALSFIQKPFDISELSEAFSKILRGGGKE